VLAIVPFIQNKLFFHSCTFLGFAGRDTNGFGIPLAIVLAVMVVPFIIAILYDHERIRKSEGSLAGDGTTKPDHPLVVPPQSWQGSSPLGWGASRALGETMAVLMVIGNVARVPHSILDPAYPLPALIANNYGEMMSVPLYDSAIMTAALIFLVIILLFNISSVIILQRVLGRNWA
jgi:phosphate transport system permease protein